jgi:zinc transporter
MGYGAAATSGVGMAIEPGARAALASAATGLVWGVDCTADGVREIEIGEALPQDGFSWLHLNLAHNAARHWLEHEAPLPPAVREVMLGSDGHQRALVDGEVVCCVLHDVRREFEAAHVDKVGVVRLALAPRLMITARLHPVGSGDIVRTRLRERGRIEGADRALDLMVGAIVENVGGFVREITAEVLKAEDAWLAGHAAPGSRQLLDIRRRLALLHRLLDGAQRVFLRLEDDDDLPEHLHPTVEKLSQKLVALDADTQGVLGQLRQLRDDLELQANQRINSNLYLLSVVTVLLMPATLVTGVFGMNTGDLPFTGRAGTFVALGIGAGISGLTWLGLRLAGFFRH